MPESVCQCSSCPYKARLKELEKAIKALRMELVKVTGQRIEEREKTKERRERAKGQLTENFHARLTAREVPHEFDTEAKTIISDARGGRHFNPDL